MEDWDQLLFDFDLTFSDDHNHASNNHSPPLSVDDIDQLLFKDELPFLHDILLDSPLEDEKSGDLSDSAHHKQNQEEEEAAVQEEDDPLAKKRKRQLRNRDAALRSRERKKMHVKDLEMKSRYYEGECRRLGSLLQWYMAENQALRFSLHSTSTSSGNASMTKQESAVLLLESLLLGSLLWLMGSIMVVLPSLVLLLVSQSQRVTVVEGKHLPSQLSLRKEEEGTKILSVGKRFKASRSRMRRGHFLHNILLPVF